MGPEATIQLIDEHGKAIYSFCMYLTQNKAEADDLYQDTFLKAIEQPEKIDGGKSPKGYLLSMAVYIWKSRKRKRFRRQAIAPQMSMDELHEYEAADSGSLEDEIISKEINRQVRGIVNSLEDKFKLVLYMYYTAELSVEEIGKVMRIPVGTVKSRLYKGRKLVKEKLEDVGYEESPNI